MLFCFPERVPQDMHAFSHGTRQSVILLLFLSAALFLTAGISECGSLIREVWWWFL